MKPWAKQTGFTIVELLIVIVVIAILAAITIVAYNGIQSRANDSAVQSDLTNLSKKVSLYNAEFGKYPTGSWLASEGVRVSKSSYYSTTSSLLFCAMSDGSSYAFVGRSKSGTSFYISSTSPTIKQHAGITGTGSTDCPAAGVSNDAGAWLHQTPPGGWAAWVQG